MNTNIWAAKYGGRCSKCPSKFKKGTLILAVTEDGKSYAHLNCPSPRVAKSKYQVCNKCGVEVRHGFPSEHDDNCPN